MEDRHILYLEIVVHKTEIKTLFVDEDSNNWSQGNMKFLSLMHFDKSVSKTISTSAKYHVILNKIININLFLSEFYSVNEWSPELPAKLFPNLKCFS